MPGSRAGDEAGADQPQSMCPECGDIVEGKEAGSSVYCEPSRKQVTTVEVDDVE